MKLSIIIVNWNVRDYLLECLMSVRNEVQIAPDDYEIIVVDNNSSDDSVQRVRNQFPDLILICNKENVGFAQANNQALAKCRGRFVMLLNPDTVLLDRAVNRMLDYMEAHQDVGIVGCRLLNSDGSFQRAAGGALPSIYNVAWHYFFLNRLLPSRWAPSHLFLEDDPQGTFDIGWISGAAMMIRRQAIEDQIFDEAFFMFGEDLDLCNRVRQAGWRIIYTNRVSVIHHHGRSMEKQSSFEIMSAALKGPRLFFTNQHGRIAAFVFDLILIIGFLLRWSAFKLMSILYPKRNYCSLASASRRYAIIALKMLFSHN